MTCAAIVRRLAEPMQRQDAARSTEELGTRKHAVAAMMVGARRRSSCAGPLNDHFTFLGYREYKRRASRASDEVLVADAEDSGMGLLRGQATAAQPRLLTIAGGALHAAKSGSVDALILTKTNARARPCIVPGYMDYIGVLELRRQAGRPTSRAAFPRPVHLQRLQPPPVGYSTVVRQRHEYVMSKSGLDPNSHSGKALRHILETLPREELFQSSEEELFQHRHRASSACRSACAASLFLRRDRYGRLFLRAGLHPARPHEQH